MASLMKCLLQSAERKLSKPLMPVRMHFKTASLRVHSCKKASSGSAAAAMAASSSAVHTRGSNSGFTRRRHSTSMPTALLWLNATAHACLQWLMLICISGCDTRMGAPCASCFSVQGASIISSIRPCTASRCAARGASCRAIMRYVTPFP